MASTTVLAEMTRRDLENLPAPPVASISNVKHLSSYNWIEAPAATPTIVVPGSPPLWSAPTVPQRLKKDSGHVYIAQNEARHPDSPLEPLFRAIYVTNPSFDIRSIDVVTDRNNIRKLLSFVSPGSTRNGLEAFTIGVEVTKNTAVFYRQEAKTHEIISPLEFKGFGHAFENAYTTSQVSGGTGHHRIITYRFGDLSFIIRYETDAYVANADTMTGSSSGSKTPEHDNLSSMMTSLSLSPKTSLPDTTTTSPPPAGSTLTIRKGGEVVTLDSTLEIKTRVFHKRLEVRDIVQQLWVSQTPKLVRAYHRNGMFRKPEVEDVAAEIKRWEKASQGELRKLAALVSKILSVAKEHGGNAVIRYESKGDKLVVCKVARKQMLPKDLYSKWDDTAVDTTKPEETLTVKVKDTVRDTVRDI